ncbi:MAG: hypothetical protein HQK62_07340 [Desulfamplus sp.]|nr:hypothetical protein [Desulfamplus sp.]
MTNQDLSRFTEIMMGMAENYSGAQLTKNGLKLRFEALRDYSMDQVTRAAVQLMKEHRFNSMPTIGDFVAVMDQQIGKLRIEDKAELEAGVVIEHLHRYGSSVNPMFEDKITSQLMAGVWRYSAWARQVKEDELKWWKQEFTRAYKAHAAGIDAGYFLHGGDALTGLVKTTVKRLPVQGGTYFA